MRLRVYTVRNFLFFFLFPLSTLRSTMGPLSCFAQKGMLHLPSLGQVTLYIITQCSRRALQAYQELHSFPNQFYYPTVMGFVNQDTVCD